MTNPQIESSPEVAQDDLAFETTTEYARRMMLGVVREFEPGMCPTCGAPRDEAQDGSCAMCKSGQS